MFVGVATFVMALPPISMVAAIVRVPVIVSPALSNLLLSKVVIELTLDVIDDVFVAISSILDVIELTLDVIDVVFE